MTMAGPQPAERPWRARLPALALGLGVAAVGVAGVEAHLREAERGETVFVAEPPGVLYGYAPGGADRQRGWAVDASPTPPPELGRRVLFLGDSVTFGVKVRPHQTWAAEVTRWLDAQSRAEGAGGVQGINLSMNGYDASQVAALVEGVAAGWAPSLVVWGAYANDVAPTTMLYRASDGRGTWVRPGVPAEVAVVSPRVDGWLVPRLALWRRLLAARFARQMQGRRGATDDPDLVDDALARLAAWSDTRGVPVAVVALPPHVLADPARCPESFGGDPERCRLDRQRHGLVARAIEASGLPWIDALPLLQASGEPHFHPPVTADPDHPNPAGHRVFARAALPLLQRQLGLTAGPPVEALRPPPSKKSSRDHPRPDRPGSP